MMGYFIKTGDLFHPFEYMTDEEKYDRNGDHISDHADEVVRYPFKPERCAYRDGRTKLKYGDH